MSHLEIFGTALAALYIFLAIKEDRRSWLAAVASSIAYILVFWKASLYYQSVLQIFFIVSSIYGWLAWSPALDLKVARLSLQQNILVFFLAAGLTAVAFGILATYAASPAPLLDSATSVFSVIATFLTARKKIECWWYWIFINLASVWLFQSQGLQLTATIYLGFLILALIGLRRWWNELKIGPVVTGGGRNS